MQGPPNPQDKLSALLRQRGPRKVRADATIIQKDGDAIVQQTDDDAALSRLSAVRTGYLSDNFASLLAPSSANIQVKLPIINRGTYVRTTAIDMLVDSFLKADRGRQKQIISLGAGSDTRYFRLAEARQSGHSYPIIYHELDFATVAQKKAQMIAHNQPLRNLIAGDEPEKLQIDPEAGSIRSPEYYLHPIDLRTLGAELHLSQPPLPSSSSAPASPSKLDGVEPDAETLIISECCLIYLTPDKADQVVTYFTRQIFPADAPLHFILYEPIKGDDAFGKVMTRNLATRGIVLRTLQKYASLELQKLRLRTLGFESFQHALDINQLMDHWISDTEKQRIAGLEMLDEVEEWELLAAHYCVAWASRGPELVPIAIDAS